MNAEKCGSLFHEADLAETGDHGALCTPVPSWAGSSMAASIRNCTWCHGTGAQGYTVGPRLAGQRAAYIESQLRGYAAHIRDNPLSKQYMWSAAANFPSRTRCAICRIILHRCRRKPPMMDVGCSRKGTDDLPEGFRTPISWHACLPWPGWPRRERDPRLGGLSYFYLKRRLQEWGQGYHSAPDLSDADGRQHAGAGRGRCARLISQLCQVTAT